MERRIASRRSVAGLVLALLVAGPAAAQPITNLAALGEGGRLVYFSSQYDGSTWKAEHLIDGSTEKGWAGQNKGAQSVVIAFRNNALAEVHDIIVNPYTREDPSTWAREVEFQVSTTYPFRDFRTVGTLALRKEGTDQVFSLPQPTRARYVKVRFLSNHGGGFMEAGEIQVMGKLLVPESPAPAYTNVAAAAAGARIEKYTSQYDESWAARHLLEEDGSRQWAGKSAAPQEVVIALPAVTDITDVAINNYSREDPSTWAKDVEVEVSATVAYKDYRPVGKLSMPKIGDLHTISLAAPVPARYVKVVFRTNHGGGFMEAARIRVYRTDAPGGPTAAGPTVAEQLAATGRAVVREIRFDTNSAVILPESAAVLSEIGKLLREDSKLELIIEGHTDSVGGADFNLDLSRKRAEAVKRWLADREGVSELRLATIGYGLTRPVADNATEDGRAQNRRVELLRK
jgi:outer membrane protein OmpA-like peptidoglycan-associated protein